MQIIVLGSGMVGRAIAFDLSKQFSVTAVDIDSNALDIVSGYGVKTCKADLSSSEIIKKLVADFDLVVSCVPGFMGYRTLEAIIESKKPVVDISFMPEDFMLLSEKAKQLGVCAIADCGVAPGMPNVFLGYHTQHMQVTEFFYMVGGLPKARYYPFQYKAPFSPIDVIEEYTRPARYKENGKIVVKPAMSDPELYRFDRVGDLEGFNTDGLRSLLATMEHIPNMREKTLRYPGHIAFIQALKAAGFLSTNPINVNNNELIPLEVTSRILINEWKLEVDEPEFTAMRVIIKGIDKGKEKTITYDLFDEFDPITRQSSMARTTGYTATAAVNLISSGLFTSSGVFPPELVGMKADCFNAILKYLNDRGLVYSKKEE